MLISALRKYFLCALLAGLLAVCPGCRSEPATLRIGYMICNSLEETQARFAPLTAYLEEATGARYQPVYLDTHDVEEAFGRGELDLVHTNSLLYVILRERHRAELVAAESRGSYGARTRGVVIARKGSGIETLADLKGERLIFGPQWAPFGFLSQYALLLEAGIDPESDLGLYAFPKGTWKHEKIIYAVLYGAYAAGAAPLIDLEEMAAEGRIAAADFVLLGRSELAPYCTISARSNLPSDLRARLQAVLLALTPDTTVSVGDETLQVLKRGRIAGFEVVQDGDYEVIRRWARSAKMPPYEEY